MNSVLHEDCVAVTRYVTTNGGETNEIARTGNTPEDIVFLAYRAVPRRTSMTPYFKKMRGGDPLPARAPASVIVRSFIGALLAIGVVAFITSATATPLVLGSFGASCVLLFGYPDNPFSQPRNVIGGHFITTLTGLAFLALLGASWWSMSLALATAIVLMQLTRTVHPPAGSNPIIVMLALPGWDFLVTPTLAGAAAIVVVAVLFNNLDETISYPRRWR
jgi:CBS-domain-containing membrane protein